MLHPRRDLGAHLRIAVTVVAVSLLAAACSSTPAIAPVRSTTTSTLGYAPSSSVPMAYSVIGTGTADITYTTYAFGAAQTVQLPGVTLPWTKTIQSRGIKVKASVPSTDPSTFTEYKVSATSTSGSTPTCMVAGAGMSPVIDTPAAGGEASCSAYQSGNY